jgi:hypothetical protein
MMKIHTNLVVKLKHKLKRILGFREYRELDLLFISIRKQVEEYLSQKQFVYRPKIMYGPLFSTYEPCSAHDFLLIQALLLRGAQVFPVAMGKLEEGESVFCGGIWGGYAQEDELRRLDLEEQHFAEVNELENLLWHDCARLDRLFLSDYLTLVEKNEIREQCSDYPLDDYKNWIFDDMPIGKWALDVLRNNYLVQDETVIPSYKVKMHGLLYNIALCICALNKLIDQQAPDIIISNDSFYYPWSIVEILAKRKNIPFYSYWTPLASDGASAYTYNDAAMNLDLSLPWKSWLAADLSDRQIKFIDLCLHNRRYGNSMVLNTADPSKNNTQLVVQELEIDKTKPTALLAANVIWDLAALNKEIQFKNMFDWIIQTIKFFSEHKEWQLIIKPHPVEENKHIPVTRQKVKDVISSHFTELPSNIVVLDSRTTYQVYDFFDLIKVGLVFTSTVGLELACHGIPVVTAGKAPYHGKGFTYDTNTQQEYFDVLKTLMESNQKRDDCIAYAEMAKKFYLLQYFHYYSRINFFDYSIGSKNPVKVAVRDIKDLLPGANPVLDYVCDSILNHLPIVSEDRNPPFVEPKVL